MKYPFDLGFEVIEAGQNREKEDKLYQLYVACYPYFTEETYVSFSDFKGSTKPQEKHSKEEILSSVSNIITGSFRKEKIDGY